MQGYSTLTAIQRESSPGVLQGTACAIAGRKTVWIGKQELGQYSRLNMARMINATGALFGSHELVIEHDLQLDPAFLKTVMWAVGHEFDEYQSSATVVASGESGDVRTCALLIRYEDGTQWSVNGAVLVALELTIQPRRLVSCRLAFGALTLTDITGQGITWPTAPHRRPVSHLDAAIAMTTAAEWAGDPINQRLDPVFGITFRFERDFAPARFDESGTPARWQLGYGWRAVGSMVTRIPDATLWHQGLRSGFNGKIGALIRPLDQTGKFELYCDAARLIAGGQDAIARQNINTSIEWTSYQSASSTPLRIAATF